MRDFIKSLIQEFALPYGYWNDERVSLEAKKYKTPSEFQKGSPSAYTTAKRKGKDFWDQVTSHMTKKKEWTDDEIIKIANKYTKQSDFISKDKGAASAARRRGDDFWERVTGHMEKGYYKFWSDDDLEKEALKYNSRTEFQKGSKSADSQARNRGKDFYDKITSHMKKLKKDRWSDEELEIEAKKFGSRGDFQKYSNSAYLVARNRGKEFFDKITHHMVGKLSNFTNQDLRKIASEYQTKKEFREKNPKAYSVALTRGDEFYDDITSHMDKLQQNWTDENLRKEALKYQVYSDFIKFSASAYQTAKKKRSKEFLDDITKHMDKTTRWTDDALKVEALKYKTRGEFQKENPVAYTISLRRGLLDDITSHMTRAGSKFLRYIYAYEFPDNHVYVGLTYNLDERNKSHMSSPGSSVYIHMKKTGLLPNRKTISELLDSQEASKVEDATLKEYIKRGWNPLNRSKPGALGGSTLKWTEEKIKDEIKKYDTLNDFYTNSPSAFGALRKLGKDKFNELTSGLKRVKEKLSDEEIEILARMYDNKMTFFRSEPKAYSQAKRKGQAFFDMITSHMKNQKTYWTDDMLRDESSKYSTRNGFAKGSPSAYTTARRRGLLDLFFPLKK